MAELIIQTEKIKDNILKLSNLFNDLDIKWSLITKVFSGDKEFLQQVLTPNVIDKINSVGDSRLTSLRNLKEVNPNLKTIYIKPPAELYAHDIIKYADISLNSSFSTILALNKEAIAQDKIHQIIIMIELGELREGIQQSDIVEFYSKVFELSNIEVIGIGSNLGCMYGVEPTYDKLLILSFYKELISSKFNKELPLISGGTSITLPMLNNNAVPKEINHFRIGEAAFFGISPGDGQQFKDLNIDTFEFRANIIEIEEKKKVPEGIIRDANIGHTADYSHDDIHETSTKAILDFGLLDVDKENISPVDKSLEFVGITSDMFVVDLGENRDEKGNKNYNIGDQITFRPNYMAVARLLNSKFIDKTFS